MANPSLKNGYIQIATELAEQFAIHNIPGNEMRIIWVVWRKTWGWSVGDRKKDWDRISYSQIEKSTGMKHMSVGKCLKSLVGKRLLLSSEKGFKFNQNYDEWVVGKRLPPVVKRLLPSRQKATKFGRQKATHNRYKDTHTKENASPSAPPFEWDKYLGRMEEHKQRHVQVIAFYFKEKGIAFDTLPKAQVAIKRHLRAAKDLSAFSDQQINQAIRDAKKDYPEFTIETLVKVLTR